MLKKIINTLSGLSATIISGIFLLLDSVPHLSEEFGITSIKILPFDTAWVTVFISGLPLLYSAVRRIIHNKGISKISSPLLISIAMIAAIFTGDIFAAGEVAFIMAIGGILEDITTNKAKKGLKKLISLAPTLGRKIKDGKEEMISADKIQRDDILRILPGETIPVDGTIISGETSIDQSVITGESLPVDKFVGDTVYCGTINRFGSMDICATKAGEDSTLKRLIKMVESAENKKAPMARIADKCASRLVPLALLIAVITWLITKDIVRAVTVLVVFCPCSLVLATPTAIMAAIGQATKYGIIIKSGEALEKMGKTDTIVFDKTGTLTYGKLEVSDIIPFDDSVDTDTLLQLCASAESMSEHPLGKAILNAAKEKNFIITEPSEFKMSVGKGIYAKINESEFLCGNIKFLKENHILLNKNIESELIALIGQGKACILIAKDSTCIGIIALSDILRPESSNIISKLNKMNTCPVLLTGDNKKTAAFFADKAGITKVFAELLPEEKVYNILKLQKEGKTVCMIGDGINDAPALKTADVGIAMGSMGSDIAVDAADIALMSDDISKIPYLKRLSVATVNTIKFGIFLSMLINFLAVALSVLGLLNPTTGALVHNAGSCFVVLIAALLYDRKFKDY